MPDLPSSLIEFPAGGLDESRAYVRQRKYSGDDGTIYTTPDALNVRSYDLKSRRRGGSRPGLQRFLQQPINQPTGLDPYSIQDLNQLIRGNVYPTEVFAPFVFAFDPGGGFGLGSTLGVQYFSGGVGTFYCSCWDQKGNAYIAESEAGKDKSFTNIYRVNSLGSGLEIWSNQEEDLAVQGMVVIGDWLYVAVALGIFSANHEIWKLSTADGAPWNGTDVTWMTQADNSSLYFSSGSHNCLAGVDRFLGAVLCGNGAGETDKFVVIDTASSTPATFFAQTASQGTSLGTEACKADSDGKFFYASMPTNNNRVIQVSPDGTVVWSATASSGSNNTIAYDANSHRVFVLNPDSGTIVTVNASTGLQMATAVSPNNSNVWDEIDCDWAGNIILWANGLASGDVYAANNNIGRIWGPNTLAGAAATHTGASCYRSDGRSSQPGRVVYLAVAGGRLSRYTRLAPTPVITPRRWSVTADRVFSWQNGPHMYYADGVDYARYNGLTDTAELWRPLVTAGELPFDTQGRACHLIATWRGRTVISGLPDEPQMWFMSRVDDPLDWDYDPPLRDGLEACYGGTAPQGLIGDIVNTIVPYSDDLLLWGCDHTILAFSGDPMDGGNRDIISDQIGMAWGRPWCRGPDGVLYFFGSRSQVYAWIPGTKRIEWISQAIEGRLKRVDVGRYNTAIRMGWHDAVKGIELYITPYDQTENAEHWFWDSRANAWWPVELAHPKMQPKAILEADADEPDDRIIHVGSWDSHVRSLDDFTKASDDGIDYRSHVAFGPFLASGLGEVTLHELQMTLADPSAAVDFEVMAGRTAERALFSTPVHKETWRPGRSTTAPIRRSGYGLYLRLRSQGVWAMESIRARLSDGGMVRRRG